MKYILYQEIIKIFRTVHKSHWRKTKCWYNQSYLQ